LGQFQILVQTVPTMFCYSASQTDSLTANLFLSSAILPGKSLGWKTQGSDPVNPNRGTQFPSLTINSNIQSTNSVLSAQLVAAVADATSQTQGILNSTSSDSTSQMASATVLGINVADDGAMLSVSILTVAGQNAAIAIPFPQLDLPLNA
jgi:hypothetical protein